MNPFQLSRNTTLLSDAVTEKAVEFACERFRRDMEKTLTDIVKNRNRIILCKKDLKPEQYELEVTEQEITIYGADARSFIYALNYLSETYLGVLPFWFWNDQKMEVKSYVEIPCGTYHSEADRIRYRGWFINDEVLISHWTAGVSKDYPWEMVFEALLRCGGNLVIPGTDKNSRIYAPIASDMGLMITHHHAEPLGAEMFLRAYPDLEPSYLKHKDLFEGLWKDAIGRQKDEEVIWNIGFRGQGDVPFWENDPAFDTPENGES